MQTVYIDSAAELHDLKAAVNIIAKAEGMIGVDTETTGLDPLTCWVRLVQIAIPDFALVVDLNAYRDGVHRQVDWERPGANYLRMILEGTKRAKVLQNGAFDLNFLWQEGIDVGGELHDTMIASKIINNGVPGVKNDLGSIHKRVLNKELPKEEQKADWSDTITPKMIAYAGKDAECLTQIMPILLETLKKTRVTETITLHDVYHLEQQAIRPIARMQKNGFWFDMEKGELLRENLAMKAFDLRTEFATKLDIRLRNKHPNDPEKWLPRDPDGSFNLRIKDTGSIRLGTKLYKGFNPGSTAQVIEKFTDAGVILKPNEKGKLSLDQNLLAFLAHSEPLIQAYLDMKEALTRESFAEKLMKAVSHDGRIHSNYRQMGTETGRMSCSDINVQQIPREKEFRELFKPTPGNKLIVADYSAMELRMAAEISGEPKMIDAFKEGADMHKATASLMMQLPPEEITKEMRTAGKVCNFALLYGAGPATLQRQAVSQFGLDWTKDQSKEYVQLFRQAYPTLKMWQDAQGTATTEAVLTKYGRRRFLFGHNDKYTTRLNTPVQGSSGDIAKIAVVMLEELMVEDKSAKLLCVCHDELVVESTPEKAEYWAEKVVECMENAGNLVCQKVPIKAEVGIGDDWSVK